MDAEMQATAAEASAAAADPPVDPHSMSLSRRYLSLPQELAGCSLPPKVAGRRFGAVTLCVAHILESAVSTCALPRVSLVRVRWWGEDRPGSLFRPSVLSDTEHAAKTTEEAANVPQRAIAMRYPVCVPPEQLLEYFHDMKQLGMDVIDRSTRRKYGHCSVPLVAENADHNLLTAEQKLAALRRDNALCEIRASEAGEALGDEEGGVVLGYLAITLEVQWTSPEIQSHEQLLPRAAVSHLTPHGELMGEGGDQALGYPPVTMSKDPLAGEGGPANSQTVQEADFPATAAEASVSDENAERLADLSSVSSLSSSPAKEDWVGFFNGAGDRFPSPFALGSTAMSVNREQTREDPVLEKKKRQAEQEHRDRGGDFLRIRQLLEKGKALQRSMERVVDGDCNVGYDPENLKEVEEEDDLVAVGGDVEADRSMKEVRQALMLAPYEELTNTMGKVVETASTWQQMLGEPPPSDAHNILLRTKYLSTAADSSPDTPTRADSGFVANFRDGIDRLQLTFEFLELERDFVEGQLRQLRDSSSVSSRFSPIQIHAFHTEVAPLFWPKHQLLSETDSQPNEVSAFSVTTSLRKRQWDLDCSHVVSLRNPPSRGGMLFGNTASAQRPSNRRVSSKQLHFFVRCENQNDINRSKRQRKRGLFCRPTKCLLLSGAVDATALFSMVSRPDETWTTTVPLFFVDEQGGRNSNEGGRDPPPKGREDQPKRKKKKKASVGHMTVKFVFCASSKSGDRSNDEMIEDNVKGESDSEVPLSSFGSRLDDLGRSNEDRVNQARAWQTSAGPSTFQRFLEQDVHPINASDTLPDNSSSEPHSREPLQFAIMLDRTTGVIPSASISPDDDRSRDTPQQSGSSAASGSTEATEGRSISLQYAVPSYFSKQASGPGPAPEKFQRAVRRKLAPSHWLHSRSLLWANFNGHINVFPSSFPVDADTYFENGFLIVEMWLKSNKGERDTLLGLSKIHLGAFSELFRRSHDDMRAFCEQVLPFVGADGAFPIENPFSGCLSGLLRARVIVGTAEQIITLTTTIRAIAALQSVVRGMQCRKRLRNRLFMPSGVLSSGGATPPVQATSALGCNGLDMDESKSDAPSAAPTASTRTWDGEPSARLEQNASAVYPNAYTNELLRTDISRKFENSSSLHKIRFDIRESWQAVHITKEATVSRSDICERSHQNQDNIGEPVLGCELQGQLVLIDNATSMSGELSSGIPFALWWDAADKNLNSFFVHSFHGRRGSNKHDKMYGGSVSLPPVGPRSQVLFALRMENGFFGAQSRGTVVGEARLNLFQTLAESRAQRTFGEGGNAKNDEGSVREERAVEVDVPIEWDAWGRGNTRASMNGSNNPRLPSTIPLKISYRVSTFSSDWATYPDQERCSTPASQLSEEESVYDVLRQKMRTTAISTTKRLLPASLALSINLLTLGDFKYTLHEKQRQLSDESAGTKNLTSQHIDELLRTNPDSVSVVFKVKICLGTEIHEREEAEDGLHRRQSNDFGATSSLLKESGRWYKCWQSPHVAIKTRVSDSGSGGDELPLEQLVMLTHLIVHAEVMTSLQEECAEIGAALWCDSCLVPHEIGCAVVPVAAVLYRPSGVEGTFPIRVGEIATGRLGVRIYLDHDHSEAVLRAASYVKQGSPRSRELQIASDAIAPQSPSLKSSTSLEEIASPKTTQTTPLHVIQVNVQEVRNLVMAEQVDLPRTSATASHTFSLLSLVNSETDAVLSVLHTDQETSADSPGRGHSEVIMVATACWKTVAVDVSMWQHDGESSGDARHGPTVLRLENAAENDVFIGKTRVDLGLLDNGWREIDGWYHLLDGRQLNRGQVKVRVVLVAEGGNKEVPAPASVEETKLWQSSWAHDNEIAQLWTETGPSVMAQTLEPSFEVGEFAACRTSEGANRALEDFKPSERDGTDTSISKTNDHFQEGDTHRPLRSDEDDRHLVVGDTSSMAPAEEAKQVSSGPSTFSHVSAGNNASSMLGAGVGGKNEVIVEEIEASERAAQQTSPPMARVSTLGLDDLDFGTASSLSEESSLEIDVGPYKPITLGSLGIEELELSPFTEASPSPQQHGRDYGERSALALEPGKFGPGSLRERREEHGGENTRKGDGVEDEKEPPEVHEAQEGATGDLHDNDKRAQDPPVHPEPGDVDVDPDAAPKLEAPSSPLSAGSCSLGHFDDGNESKDDDSAFRLDSEGDVGSEIEAADVGARLRVDACASTPPEQIENADGTSDGTRNAGVEEYASDMLAWKVERCGVGENPEHTETGSKTSKLDVSTELASALSEEMASTNEAGVSKSTKSLIWTERAESIEEDHSTKIPDATEEEDSTTRVEAADMTRPTTEVYSLSEASELETNAAADIQGGEEERSISNHADTISYVDKAVQVDLSEFEIRDEDTPSHSVGVGMTSAAMRAEPGNKYDTAKSKERHCSLSEKFNIGCDAIEELKVGSVDASQPAHEEGVTERDGGRVGKASGALVVMEVEGPKVPNNVADDTESNPGSVGFGGGDPHMQASVASSSGQSTSLQSEKLELIYGLLQEIQASCVANSGNSRISIQAPTDKDATHGAQQVLSLSEASAAEYVGDDTTSVNKFSGISAMVPQATRFAAEGRPAGATQECHQGPPCLEPPSIPRKSRTSVNAGMEQHVPSTNTSETLRFTFEDEFRGSGLQHDTENRAITTSFGATVDAKHLPLSSTRPGTKRPQVQWKRVEGTQTNALRHAASLNDSETERIARIMQGSMEYWLKDDASSGWEDEASNEDESDDDDGYF